MDLDSSFHTSNAEICEGEQIEEKIGFLLQLSEEGKHEHLLVEGELLLKELADKGKWDDGLKVAQAVLHFSRHHHGEEHPVTAKWLDWAATLSEELGLLHESLKFYLQSLHIKREVYGREEAETRKCLYHVGTACEKVGKYIEALNFYDELLHAIQRAQGEYHPDAARTHINMAEVYKAQSQSNEALQQYAEAIKIKSYLLGESHIQVSGLKREMEKIRKSRGDGGKSAATSIRRTGLGAASNGGAHCRWKKTVVTTEF